jgi:hypothetical protein
MKPLWSKIADAKLNIVRDAIGYSRMSGGIDRIMTSGMIRPEAHLAVV